MEYAIIVASFIIFAALVWKIIEGENLTINIITVVSLFGLLVFLPAYVEEYTEIRCIEGKFKYEKQYIIRNTIIVDSIYVKIEDYDGKK